MNAPEEDHWWAIMSGDVPVPDHISREEALMLIKPDNWSFYSQPSAMLEKKENNMTIGYDQNTLAENKTNLTDKYYDNIIRGKTKSWIDVYVLNKLGLSIIVVHGGGPRIKRELDKKKIISKFVNGLRVTDSNIIDTVEEVLIDFNKDIVNSLKKLGSNAASFHTKTKNIIEVVPEKEELGFVGIPKKINDNFIQDALNENKIPPTINHKSFDEDINKNLNLTLNKFQTRNTEIVMSNTFGFGGHNTSIIFKKYQN